MKLYNTAGIVQDFPFGGGGGGGGAFGGGGGGGGGEILRTHTYVL